MRVPPQVTGVHSSYGRGWMKTTTHKIWRCRKWLVCTDTNIPFSSVIYISSVTSQEKKDGICSSSSEPLSCMGINSKGEWQRFSFFVKYPAEFLLYFFSTNLSASEAVEGRICISWPCYYWLLSPFSSLRALWYFPSVLRITNPSPSEVCGKKIALQQDLPLPQPRMHWKTDDCTINFFQISVGCCQFEYNCPKSLN